MNIDWPAVYRGLHRAGYTDDQIAALANSTRNTVNRVRHGKYPFAHEPGYTGGQALLRTLGEAVQSGRITYNPLTDREPEAV